MQTLAAGAQAYQLADGVGKVADAVKNQTGQQGAVLLSVEAGFGFKTAGKEQNQNYRQSRESSLKAGGDINIRSNIRSREGNITVQGSNIIYTTYSKKGLKQAYSEYLTLFESK